MSLGEAGVRKRVEREMDDILANVLLSEKRAATIGLEEIESVVLEAGRRFQAVVAQALIEAAAGREKGRRRDCPTCEEKLRHKGYREKPLVTRVGEVRLRRAYYRCCRCGRGFFPPG